MAKMNARKRTTFVKPKGSSNCPICFVTFSSEWVMKRHVLRYKELKFKCYQCRSTFTDGALLRFHIAHEHAELKKPTLKCPVCSQLIQGKCETKSLQAHLFHYHKGWESLFVSASESCLDKNGALSVTDNAVEDQKNETKKLGKHDLAKLLSRLTRSSRNGIRNNGSDVSVRAQTNDSSSESETTSSESSSDESSSNEELQESHDDISKPQYRRSSRNSHGVAFREAELRFIYSCKDCYIPLPRITPTLSTSKLQSRHKNVKKSEEGVKKHNPFEVINIQVAPEKFSNPFIKSEVVHDETYDNQGKDALRESYDPLSFQSRIEEDSGDINESWREERNTTIGTPQQRSVLFGLPVIKSEKVDSIDADGNPGLTVNSFAQSCDPQSIMTAIKDEPMDCDIDEHPPLETEAFRNFPEFVNFASVKSDFDCEPPNESSGEFHTTAKNFEPENMFENSYINKTMIASKICTQLYSSRRTMLRHFRECHLSGTIYDSHCVCGKKMVGRKQGEKHFYRHCDEVVQTNITATPWKTPCKPLEKKYTCEKCGERFWLESCLEDHPPSCENTTVVKPIQRRINVENDVKLLMTFSGKQSKGFVCRICDVKFSTVDALLRHVRALMTNERHPCGICRSVFPGVRLLKGHIISTHKTPCITYRCFCDICNQGFTKNIYKHVHMKHIHTKEVAPSVANIIDNYDHSVPAPLTANVVAPDNQCSVCRLVFVNRQRFDDHMSYYDQNACIRCNICGESFMGQYNAHNHRKEVHYGGSNENAYSHNCHTCKEGFMYETHLHAHMFHVHYKAFDRVPLVKNLVCDTIEETLSDSASNIEEKKPLVNLADGNVAGKSLPNFVCDTGEVETLASSIRDIAEEKSLTTLSGGNSEEKTLMSSTDTTILSDPIATVSLADASSVINQGAIESCQSIATRVKCSRCNQRFSTWSGWSRHAKNFHSNCKGPLGFVFATAEPPTTDPLDVDTPTTSDGTSDEKISTKANPTNIVVRGLSDNDYRVPSHCSICGYECIGLGGVTRHEATYSNRGIYTCEFCNRNFNLTVVYRDHKLKHFRRDISNNCFCPICDEGFEHIDFLKMHTIHLHDKLLEDIPKQIIADDKNTLRERNKSTESLINGSDHNDPVSRRENRAYDRFYISNNEDTHPKVVSNEGYKIIENDDTSARMRHLFRYDDTEKTVWICEPCNVTFANGELRAIHEEIVHKRPVEFRLVTGIANQKDSLHPNVSDKLPNTVEPHNSTQKPDNKTPQLVAVTSRKVTQRITQRTGQIQATDLNPFDFSRCKPCNIVFGDKKLLARHQEQMHGSTNVKSSDDKRSSELLKITNSKSKMKTLVIDPAKTTLVTKQVMNEHTSFVSNPANPRKTTTRDEVIDISDDEPRVKHPLPAILRHPLSKGNRIISTALPNGMRLIKLPPGNYKIAKLKVRSVDTVVGKLMKYPKSTDNKIINCIKKDTRGN